MRAVARRGEALSAGPTAVYPARARHAHAEWIDEIADHLVVCGVGSTGLYEVPAEVLEDAERLREWAGRAADAACCRHESVRLFDERHPLWAKRIERRRSS